MAASATKIVCEIQRIQSLDFFKSIELIKFHRAALAQQHAAYQNKVTSQTTMSHVQFTTGIQLISASQKSVLTTNSS